MRNNIERIELKDHVRDSYMSYSMAVIVDRALPDVRDGLLPVHRRILYSMHNKGLTYNKHFAKSSEPVAETMKIHPHGDSSIYSSLSLLTDRNETLLHPFIEGDGSFGKVYSTDSASHMRYTSCRLNQFAQEMFTGLKQNAVKIIGEEGHYQPIVLPNTFPNILVKPNSAIAVGEACNFGSFPLSEVCDLTISYIDDKNINVIDYLTPDFSTGASLIYNKAQLNTIYETGKGKVVLRSKYRYIAEENMIEVYEIPYSTTAQKIISEIIDKIPTKLKEVTDVRDETGFNKDKGIEELKITIDVKKNTNIDILMAKLFKETSLETTFSFNMNCLVNNRPKVLGIKAILDNWLDFSRECIINTMNYTINKKSATLHLLLGLEKILLNIDKTIEIIRQSDGEEVITNLMDYFGIDNVQAEYISEIKLKNINKDYIIKQIKDIECLKNEVATLQHNVQDISYINKQIQNNLKRVRDTYKKDRKTEIIYEDNISTISQSAMIEDYTTTNILTREMYYKKCRRYAEADKQRVKDGDEIISMLQCSNTGKVMFLSNMGNIYPVNINDMEEKTPSSMGVYLPSILPLETDEIIIGMLATSDYKGNALILYDNGKLAKIPMNSYKTKTNRSKLSNCLSKEDTMPIMISQSTVDVDIYMTDIFGKEKIINTATVNIKKSRDTVGVTVWNSKKQGFKLVACNIMEINK